MSQQHEKRSFYAAHALNGLLAGWTSASGSTPRPPSMRSSSSTPDRHEIQRLARLAFDAADEMIKIERTPEPEGNPLVT